MGKSRGHEHEFTGLKGCEFSGKNEICKARFLEKYFAMGVSVGVFEVNTRWMIFGLDDLMI